MLLLLLSINWDGLLILSGDMNIDFLQERNPIVRQYNELLQSLNLHQHVKKPTRVTNVSATLIDHIVSNYPNRITHTDVLPCALVSKHDGPYACIKSVQNAFNHDLTISEMRKPLIMSLFKMIFLHCL